LKKFILRVFSGDYTILLTFLFFLFVFRPYTESVPHHGIWKTFLTIALIIAIFNCEHRHKVKIAISCLAVPTVILSWINLFDRTPQIFIAVAVLTSSFMLICAGSILYDVVLRAKVTLETLRGVICAFFLIAFIFAYIYVLVEYLNPGTMLIRSEIFPISSFSSYLAQMLYFSFVTLLTIGYGDIVPTKEWGQTMVVIEGIIGQFYIAILVARLVSVYSMYSSKEMMQSFFKRALPKKKPK
jgi:hypothetical protein